MGKKKNKINIASLGVGLIIIVIVGFLIYDKYFKEKPFIEPPVDETFMGMCYQETANVSTSCGGLASGSYSVTSVGTPTGYEDLHIIYNKPARSTGAVWQAKYFSSSVKTLNYTIPNACFQRSNVEIVVQVYGLSTTGTQYLYAKCNDGTSAWSSLISSFSNGASSGFGTASSGLLYDGNWNTGAVQINSNGWKTVTTPIIAFYEEGIYWNITG